MKTQAVAIMPDVAPRWQAQLYEDSNGNWFAAVLREEGRGLSENYTATYTTPREAVDAAYKMKPPERAKP